MAILLTKTIKALQIIELPKGEKPDPQCFGSPSSYDLRLGSEFYVPEVDAKKRNVAPIIQDCSQAGTLEIPPFSAVLVSTFETVHLPAGIAGRWDLKIKWAMAGLVFQMGTQIEPGYRGRLFGLLYNLTDRWRPIPYKARLWAVEFIQTNGSARLPSPAPPPRLQMKEFIAYGKPSGSINILAERTDDAWKELRKVTQVRSSVLLVIITVILSIVLPVAVTKFTYDKDDQPLTNVGGLQKSLEDLRTERDSQIKKLESLVDAADKKFSEAEKRFHDLADAKRQEWVREPTLYDVERLQYLRRQRESLRATAPDSAELKNVQQEIAELAAKLTGMPNK